MYGLTFRLIKVAERVCGFVEEGWKITKEGHSNKNLGINIWPNTPRGKVFWIPDNIQMLSSWVMFLWSYMPTLMLVYFNYTALQWQKFLNRSN